MKAKIVKVTLRSLDKKIAVLASKMATKDDLKRFATKDDLKRFATKDDLKRFATKDDLKRFATKDDIIDFKDEILGEIRDARDEVSLVSGRNAMNRDALEDHEVRITKLETTFSFPK